MSSTYAASSQHDRSHIRVVRATNRARRRIGRTRTHGLSMLEVSLLVLIVFALVAGIVSTSVHPVATIHSRHVSVDRGDTLWSIAQAHPVPGQTTAQTADMIAQINGLHGANVAPGQSLQVPALPDELALASR